MSRTAAWLRADDGAPPASLEARLAHAWASVRAEWRAAFGAAVVLTVVVVAVVHPRAALAVGLLVAGLAAATAALVDVHEHRLPNALVGAVAAASFAGAAATGEVGVVGMACLGGVIAAVLMLSVHLSRGVGMGDVKLAGAVGLSVGPLGVLAAPMAVGIAALVAAVAGFVTRRSRLALGPALWLGWAVAAVVASEGWLS